MSSRRVYPYWLKVDRVHPWRYGTVSPIWHTHVLNPQREIRVLLTGGGRPDSGEATGQYPSYLDGPWTVWRHPGDSYSWHGNLVGTFQSHFQSPSLSLPLLAPQETIKCNGPAWFSGLQIKQGGLESYSDLLKVTSHIEQDLDVSLCSFSITLWWKSSSWQGGLSSLNSVISYVPDDGVGHSKEKFKVYRQ